MVQLIRNSIEYNLIFIVGYIFFIDEHDEHPGFPQAPLLWLSGAILDAVQLFACQSLLPPPTAPAEGEKHAPDQDTHKGASLLLQAPRFPLPLLPPGQNEKLDVSGIRDFVSDQRASEGYTVLL